ncbi:MAG: MgtC/SapB family protein [Pseudonocardiaceae bacterium]
MVIINMVAIAAGHGQGWRQVGELLLAFGLSSAVGAERQLRGKPAGLRTQSIVGTSAALILLVSKYGFADVLSSGAVVLDPSRVAAQIVSGIGFLGAGLIITRRGAIRGLTTAAAVWETAAIGMAAGAGLPLLAGVVTALHFVIVFGYTALSRRLLGADRTVACFSVVYEDGRGVLRDVLATCTARGWSITSLTTDGSAFPADAQTLIAAGNPAPRELVTVTLELSGPSATDAVTALGVIAGVVHIEQRQDDED